MWRLHLSSLYVGHICIIKRPRSLVCFRSMGKTRWPTRSLVGWGISTSPLTPLNGIQQNFKRSKDHSVLYQVWNFFSGWLEKQDSRRGLWLVETFQVLLWNCWTEFNDSWQKERSQCPLLKVDFSGRSVNKNIRHVKFIKKVVHCTQVHVMWSFDLFFVTENAKSQLHILGTDHQIFRKQSTWFNARQCLPLISNRGQRCEVIAWGGWDFRINL